MKVDESQLVPLTDPVAPGQLHRRVFNLTFAAYLNQVSGFGFEINRSQYISSNVPTLLNILSGTCKDTDLGSNKTHM